MPDCWAVRPIESADVTRLPVVEEAADRLLVDQIGPEAFSGVTPGETRVAAPGFVLVVGRPCVGFAQVLETGEGAHLQQLAVDPDYGRRGLGAALVQGCVDEAARRGHGTLTLTTFRDLAFNAPWYGRIGFEVVEQPTGVLAQHLADERALARLMPRVAMTRSL